MRASSMRTWASLIVVLAAILGVPSGALAQSASPAPALKGYDPVAYFTEGKPVKGTAGNSYEWDEARYLFSNPKNKAAFASAPDKYAPQFTGLCSTGLAFGQKVEADPQIWKIVDGKLYLFSSLKAKETADSDPSVLSRAHTGFQGKKK